MTLTTKQMEALAQSNKAMETWINRELYSNKPLPLHVAEKDRK